MADKLPAGATNLKKNLATGMGLKSAEAKATTTEQQTPKKR